MATDQFVKSNADALEERTLRFDADEDCARLDLFLTQRVEGMSRSHLQKIIRHGAATINGSAAKPKSHVRAGDSIVVVVPPPTSADIIAEDIPFGVIFEDDSLIVVNKPRGLIVHPTMNRTSGTLVNAIMHHCGDNLSGIRGALRPGIVHRLDKDTSGVMVVAKSDPAHLSLCDQIKNRTVEKYYVTIVHGVMRNVHGEVNAPIGRNPRDRKKMAVVEKGGRRAVTEYSCIDRFRYFSFVDVRLHTGRTHQIRVHMAHLGNPVAGDPTYGGTRLKERSTMGRSTREGLQSALERLEGQALHSRELTFTHPMTGELLTFEAPMPRDMQDFLDFLRAGGENEV